MSKERRVGPAKPAKPVARTLGPMDEPLEFAAHLANDIEVEPFESWTQLRPVEVAVVADPAADARVVHRGQLSQGQVTAVVKGPASNRTPDTL